MGGSSTSRRSRPGVPAAVRSAARALAGAVMSVPANADRLRAEGLENSSRVLEAYLIPGAPAYRGPPIPRCRGNRDDPCRRRRRGVGSPVLGHHGSAGTDDPARIRQPGIDGVEAFYVTYDEAQTRSLVALATELGLLTTGSSDFHGPEHPLFSRSSPTKPTGSSRTWAASAADRAAELAASPPWPARCARRRPPWPHRGVGMARAEQEEAGGGQRGQHQQEGDLETPGGALGHHPCVGADRGLRRNDAAMSSDRPPNRSGAAACARSAGTSGRCPPTHRPGGMMSGAPRRAGDWPRR